MRAVRSRGVPGQIVMREPTRHCQIRSDVDGGFADHFLATGRDYQSPPVLNDRAHRDGVSERVAVLAGIGVGAHGDGMGLISLTVNFYPEPDEPIDSAAVGLTLSHNGPSDAKPAIAWSVWPVKLSVPMSTTSTVAVTAKLGLLEPNASRTTKQDRDKPFLLGLGEGQSDPEWRFRRSPGHEIEGIQQLAAIIRGPRGAQVTGEITIAASILRRVAGLVRYRARLPPGLATVSLPAHG